MPWNGSTNNMKLKKNAGSHKAPAFFLHDSRKPAAPAFHCFMRYILSGAEKPSTSMQVSSTFLVSKSSAIQPAFFA